MAEISSQPSVWNPTVSGGAFQSILQGTAEHAGLVLSWRRTRPRQP